MIDLTAKPFCLDDAARSWVRDTLARMTVRQRVQQLFCLVAMSEDLAGYDPYLAMEPAGIMFRALPARKVREVARYLQDRSAIPLLIAANLESGGDGITTDGTSYADPLAIAATDDVEMARRLGEICAREGYAVGGNWAFAPVIDIDYNHRNPITNTRAYGSDPDRVLAMSSAYMAELQGRGFAVSIKHFPGDGVDERDQHLCLTHNELGCDEWMATYGRNYRRLIDEGALTVMVGHITQPAWQKRLNPALSDADLRPATLSPELLQGLLRGELGFNGLIVTDATTMLGFATAMPRREAVPYSIAAGCDMFLFTRNPAEDFAFMMRGVEQGVITAERLDEAVTRVLALKAALKLHERKAEGTLVPPEDALADVGCEKHGAWAREVADRAVTLVKDTQHLLPLTPRTHPRLLVFALGDEISLMSSRQAAPAFLEALRRRGFQVTVNANDAMDFQKMFMGTDVMRENYDAVIYMANLKTASNRTVLRLNWAPPMGSDAPWFSAEVPTLFVSLGSPYHLLDVPQVKTYINAYYDSDAFVEAVVAKIAGESAFRGRNPVDPFCGRWDAKL